MSHYESAQVCMNGHPTTGSIEKSPQRLQNFCSECGEVTIMACVSCHTKIRGFYNSPNIISFTPYKPPKFCHHCGKAYPWTETTIVVAKELTQELDSLNEQDKQVINDNIADLSKESPKTVVAAERIKKVMTKAGTGAGEVLKKVITDIASETAKKILFPNHP